MIRNLYDYTYLPYGKLELKTAPTLTAVSLSEAKTHLRIDSDFSADDTYITTLIKVATNMVEEFTRIKVMEQTLTISYDNFYDLMTLQVAGVTSIESIKYQDNTNTQQTLSADNYVLDDKSKPSLVYLADNKTYPDTFDTPNAVVIEFKAGKDDATNVVDAIKHAILIIVGRYYENRQDVIVGSQVNTVPLMVERLLTPYRAYDF